MNFSDATSNPTQDPDLVNQDDIQYTSIQHQRKPGRVERSPPPTAEDRVQYACVQHRRDPQREKSSPAQASGSADEAQYASVHSHNKTKLKKTQEDDDQYANVRFNSTGAAYRLEKPV